MKRLLLVRHAKSSWKYDLKDVDRPLKKRGQEDAKLISNHVTTRFKRPEFIGCSIANRTQQTAEYFYSLWGIDSNSVIIDESLYDFSGSHLTNFIRNCSDSFNTILIFGHNYAITNFANTYGSEIIDNVPTCGVLVFDFNIKSWQNLNQGKTIYKLFPKDLK